MKKIIIYFTIVTGIVLAQQTPLQFSNYARITSHSELSRFIKESVDKSKLITSEVLAQSVEGKELYVVYFSKTGFANDKSKIKVLLFCQQHGNEQSGKEGALLLIQELLKPENLYLFDRIDLALVPQMNPDGSEKNTRRNGNKMDLNRNHLILTEPETIGLHQLFDKFLFEVTMDVHEYYSYGESWKKFGYRANNDLEIGTSTNINIPKKIRNLEKAEYLPFIKTYLNKHSITYFEYSPGSIPENEYVRHSTFDINDGRQSMGIQNTFSFIQEGMNGADALLDNVKNRAYAQMIGMKGLLEYSYRNKSKIKRLVVTERNKLITNRTGNKIAIQLDHFPDGSKLEYPLLSYYSNKDTTITVSNYRPIVKALFEVTKPLGYLVPKSIKEIMDWADRNQIKYHEYNKSDGVKLEQYYIASIDSMNFEGDTVVNPVTEIKTISNELQKEKYFFIPMNQLKSNLIVIALEPKSELGLITYKKFEHLLKKGENYPVLRVVR